MEKQKTLILIDGHALAFRQYYALERTGMHTSDGIPTWAVYGFFKAIFDLLKDKNLKPDAIGVTFDVSHQTFRVEEYSEYKSNRVAMPDDMRYQMDLIYEGLQAFDIPIYTKEGYEADDVIGTISDKVAKLGHKTLILTGDQDSFQLIDKGGLIKVIIPTKGILKEYDWEKVHEKLGVYPDQVVDYKSLRGDTSDNIPGVKGVGEKTAVKLLEKYGHLQQILDDCDNMPDNNVKKCLCSDIEMAKKSYFLATIIKDVDIDFDFDSTKISLPDISQVSEFLKKMQFFSFLKNINTILSYFNKEQDINASSEKPEILPVLQNNSTAATQLGLFSQAINEQAENKHFKYQYKNINNNEDIPQILNILEQKSLLAFDILFNENLVNITFAYSDDYIFNKKFQYKNNNSTYQIYIFEIKPSEMYLLKPLFENPDIKKITHDLKTAINLLYKFGINIKGSIFDTLLASYIKNPARNHNLDAQSIENINYILDKTAQNSTEFFAQKTIIIFELTNFWINKLEDKELKLLFDIELPLSFVLAKMELNGVSLDFEYLHQLSTEMSEKLTNLEHKIYDIAGKPFNINSPKQVGEVLFDTLQLKTKKKRGKNKYSTSAEVLDELAEDNEIVRLILEYRKYAKLKSTYTDSLPELVNKQDNRIHTTYNQTITVTGRLSSSNPNLQNIPARTEEGNKIRKAFVPQNSAEALILSADYSQIELRLLAHVSKDKNLIDAFNSGEDIHSLTASKVFGVTLDKVTKEMRYHSKAVNFGIIYGQSKYGLAKALKISTEEAEIFINKYFETYPKVKEYMEKMTLYAEKYGYVETLFGRKRYLNAELNSSNHMIREFGKRAAINHPMQGTAADLIKIAMVDFDKKLTELKLKSKLIIQVHDELVVEVFKNELDKVKNLVKECMELNQPLLVPLVVDINTGETWQEQ